MHEINVIALAPLPGSNAPRSHVLLVQIPLNVQSAQADDSRQIHGQSFTDLLQHFQRINATRTQGDP